MQSIFHLPAKTRVSMRVKWYEDILTSPIAESLSSNESYKHLVATIGWVWVSQLTGASSASIKEWFEDWSGVIIGAVFVSGMSCCSCKLNLAAEDSVDGNAPTVRSGVPIELEVASPCWCELVSAIYASQSKICAAIRMTIFKRHVKQDLDCCERCLYDDIHATSQGIDTYKVLDEREYSFFSALADLLANMLHSSTKAHLSVWHWR